MGCVAVVFARLIDFEGIDRGIKSFIVRLHDGQDMTAGVTSKYVPRFFSPVRMLTEIFSIDYCHLAEALARLTIRSLTSTACASLKRPSLEAPREPSMSMQSFSRAFSASPWAG